MDKIRPYIEEVWREHADPNSPEYNRCDTEPCAWCTETKDILERPQPLPITDYHDFTWVNMPLKDRKKLNVGPIYINAVTCGECGWFVRSKNRHDYRSCKCGNVSVDGGSEYAKRTFKTNNYVDIIVNFTELDEYDA